MLLVTFFHNNAQQTLLMVQIFNYKTIEIVWDITAYNFMDSIIE